MIDLLLYILNNLLSNIYINNLRIIIHSAFESIWVGVVQLLVCKWGNEEYQVGSEMALISEHRHFYALLYNFKFSDKNPIFTTKNSSPFNL